MSTVDSVRWFSNAAALRAPLVKVVDAIQAEPPAVQVLAVAATLQCMSDALGIDSQDIVSRVKRMTRDIDGPFSKEWQAMREYTRGELIK